MGHGRPSVQQFVQSKGTHQERVHHRHRRRQVKPGTYWSRSGSSCRAAGTWRCTSTTRAGRSRSTGRSTCISTTPRVCDRPTATGSSAERAQLWLGHPQNSKPRTQRSLHLHQRMGAANPMSPISIAHQQIASSCHRFSSPFSPGRRHCPGRRRHPELRPIFPKSGTPPRPITFAAISRDVFPPLTG